MWKGPEEFLNYTRKQRNGILILVTLVVLFWGAFLILDFNDKPSKQDFSEFKKTINEWELADSLAKTVANSHSFFYFDPNTCTDSSFIKLGLSKKQIRIINNYKSKGGQFRKPEDLKSIYSIDSVWFQEIKDYIRIKAVSKSYSKKERSFSLKKFDPNAIKKSSLIDIGLYEWEAKRILTYREKVKPFQTKEELFKVYGLDSNLVLQLVPFIEIDSTSFLVKLKKIKEVVEINSADSAALIQVNGIGGYFASRIIKYRNKLGGFYAKEQLMEVYGLDSSRFAKMEAWVKIDDTQVNKLNVNTATFKELVNHPYLSFEVVKNIANFRDKIRPFQSIEELKNIELVDERLFIKIAKYLEV